MSIASELSRLLQAKSDLATSITNKGVTVPAAATLDDYPALVDSIQQGGTSLPYDAEVAWLKSDGNAYINTGIPTTSNTRVVISFTIPSSVSSNLVVFGGRVALNNKSNALFYLTNGNWSWRYGDVNKNTSHNNTTGDFVASNKTTAKTLAISGAMSTTITSDSATFTTEYPMYIFCLNNGGSIASIAKDVKVKYCQIYNGSALVRDYIPVIKSGVGYLYDKESGELFGNANSTGSFIYGNDVAY